MGQVIDISGQRFGKLLILERDYEYPLLYKYKARDTWWKCLCDCGNMISVSKASLRGGKTHCGCDFKDNRDDITGQRFGQLVVLGKSTEKGHQNRRKWLCKCDCRWNCSC